MRETLERCPGLVPDHILLGNVLQAANGQNPARQAAIRGGVARATPGTTINDVCLASMTSVALAAGMVREGEADCVLVGGFDSMSRAPHAVQRSADDPILDLMVHDGLYCSIGGVGMGELSDAENVRLEVTRAAQDMLALRSHERAAAATAEGRLADEIVPLPELAQDEGIRTDTSLERLAALQPAFGDDGTITAGNASQVSDGGAAGIVTTLGRARAAGLEPLAEVVGRAIIAGPDSSLHLRPAEASEKLLARHGLTAARHRPLGDQRGLRGRRGRLRRRAGHRSRAGQRQRRCRRDRPSPRGLRDAPRAHPRVRDAAPRRRTGRRHALRRRRSG